MNMSVICFQEMIMKSKTLTPEKQHTECKTVEINE